MGIPFLTRHLYPFAETIVFGEPQKVQRKQTEYVEAVVIDGPSLVYHVSMRLLSLSNGSSQPTCDENPFIVPAVFEDLKHRWCKKNINSVVKNVPDLSTASLSDFPWGDAVVMVPGEADTYCAHVARLTGCAILTNDSDLLLHDLGKRGSVVLLDSIEPWTYDASQHGHPLIRALRLCPDQVARRLGLTSLLPLAYELKIHPDTGLKQLIQQAKDTDDSTEHKPGYCQFAEEYQSSPSLDQETLYESYPQHLDPRISELFSLRGRIRDSSGQLCMYLVVLNEDPARQCAWAQGKLYRSMGYSALNLSFSDDENCDFVDETLLDNLPPLSILMRPGHEMAQEFRTGCSVNDHVDRLVKLMGKCSDEDSAQYVARSHTDRDDSVTPPTGMNGFGDVRARRPTRTLANMYELLPEQ
ncbi:Glycosyl hydrolases 28 family protein [Aspergillus niger]|uniref:Glycosyl hydrolases 28 family protein n=1 Tax=Aspergillus niger TaxID=5061 RepID=A0A505IKA6_ASPNG|nr:Glycosyl hydrolases 28 family protein [Aspergillus niger]